MAAEADCGITDELNKLLEIKKAASELGMGEHIKGIDDYIAECSAELDAAVKDMASEKNGGWEELNKLFLDLIG